MYKIVVTVYKWKSYIYTFKMKLKEILFKINYKNYLIQTLFVYLFIHLLLLNINLTKNQILNLMAFLNFLNVYHNNAKTFL